MRQRGGVQNRFSSESSAEFRAGSSGETIEVYEFQRESTAELEAGRVNSNNQPPFFYQEANLLVVHEGTDQRVASTLLSFFGHRVR